MNDLPQIIIYRDNDGDFTVSFDGGNRSYQLTRYGYPDIQGDNGLVCEGFEHEVWRSGSES